MLRHDQAEPRAAKARRRILGRAAVGACLAAPLALGTPAAGQTPFKGLVVLGDSNTDAGNAEIASLAAGDPSPTPAAVGYFQGRFSNGPTLADTLSAALFGDVTTPSLAGGFNFGFGGASAATDVAAGRAPNIVQAIPDFEQQVDQYLAQGVQPDALHMIAFGNNGAVPAVFAGVPPEDLFTAAGDAYTRELTRLADAGARYFVVVTNKNVGADPALNGGDVQGGVDALSPLVQGMKETILQAAGEAFNARSDAEAYVFDFVAVSTAIAQRPEEFGFAGDLNATPCLAVPAAPPACDGFRSFDGIHPTAAVFEIAGRALAVAVEDQYAAPRSVGAFAETAALSAWDAAGRAARRAHSRPAPGAFAVADAAYSGDEREADATALGYDTSVASVAAGLGYAFSPQASVVAGLEYETEDVDGAGDRFSFEREAIRAFTAARLVRGPWDFSAVFTAGHEDVGDYRRALSDGRIAGASTNGHSLAGRIEAGFSAGVGSATLRPFARLEQLQTALDGYEETGADGLMNLNSRIEDIETDATVGSLGVELSSRFSAGAWTVQPRLAASYSRFSDEIDHDVIASLVDYPEVTRTLAVDGLGDEASRVEGEITAQGGGGSSVSAYAGWRGAMDGAQGVSFGARARIVF